MWLVAGALIIGCNDNATTSSASTSGKSGSLARFAVVGHYLYTVDRETMRLFDIESGTAKFLADLQVGFNIETIFARGNALFLGSRNGVYIYDISIPDKPAHLSTYQHIASCDPVVADDNYAYSTLSTGRPTCWRGTNVLDIIDISNLSFPKQVTTLLMNDPRGLGIVSSNRLVVCDQGLKLIDISNRILPKLLCYRNDERPFDIIPSNNSFIAVIPGGLANYIVQSDTLQLIGKLVYK